MKEDKNNNKSFCEDMIYKADKSLERKITSEELKLIPKVQEYIQYMLEIIFKLPRVEKFSIGNEYKVSMYQMIKYSLYMTKNIFTDKLLYLNKIDVHLNCQRIYLRIMIKNKWIDERKFGIAISKIAEIGRIIGGLMKYYAKDN